jgi:hypothetical protein
MPTSPVWGSCPDPEAEVLDRGVHRGGAADGPSRRVEDGQEPVPRGRDLAASVHVELSPETLVVLDDQGSPGCVAHPPENRGRVDDVREQDGREHPIARRVGRLAVPTRVRPLDRHVGDVAVDPGVMARWDLVDIAGIDVHLRPVVHHDMEPSADREGDVPHLAARGADDGLHVGRPAPTRRQRDPADDRLVEVDGLDLPPPERANPIRSRERLPLEAWHRRPLSATGDDRHGASAGQSSRRLPKEPASMLSR